MRRTLLGGSNTVTVTFSQAAAYPDVRILEYTDVNAVDVTAGASGNSGSANSGVGDNNGGQRVNLRSRHGGDDYRHGGKRIHVASDHLAGRRYCGRQSSDNGREQQRDGDAHIVRTVGYADGDLCGDIGSAADGNSRESEQRYHGRRYGGDDHRNELCCGSDGHVWKLFGNQCGRGKRNADHGDNAGRECGSGDGDGEQSRWAERWFGGGVHLHCAADGDERSRRALGPVAGGTAVTITGTNFASGATVTFGGTAATSVIVTNSTTITATTPAHAAGAVAVTVTNSNGLSGTPGRRIHVHWPPTVTRVSPSSGSTAGGTAVTITGTNFAVGATVTFGTSAASNVVVVSATTNHSDDPGGECGSGDRDGDQCFLAERKSGKRVYLHSDTDSNERIAKHRTGVRRYGGNDHRNELCSGSDGDLRRDRCDQCGGDKPHDDHGDYTGWGWSGNGNGYSERPERKPWPMVSPTAEVCPLLLAGLTAGAGSGPTVAAVQSYINSTFLTTHTTAAFNSTGGDSVILFASSHFEVTFTPTDNFGNTWISIAGPTTTALGFDLGSQMWYAPHPIVGAGHTITMNLSQSMPLVMSVFVVKGSNTSSPIDAISLIGSDNGTQSVNVVSPTVTTVGSNDLLIGFTKVSAGATFQPGTGFTQQAGASSNFLDAESGLAVAPGTYAATFTIDSAQTWQSAVVAVSNNPNQTTLSWTASTEIGGTISQYLVERCSGTGCTSFTQVGTTTSTSYNDTGLTGSTSYSYRVRAQDTNGIDGPYSSVVSLTTPPANPSLPGNLTATSPSNTAIDLSWTASTETGGTISDYLVERCLGASCTNFVQIGTSSSTIYLDSGLTTGNTYNYRVRAADVKSNVGPYSNVASAIPETPDTQPPTAPSNLTATPGEFEPDQSGLDGVDR